MMDSLKMSQAHFQVVLGKLRMAGFLVNGDINPKYIPHKIEGDNRFMLAVVYDWSSMSNPIRHGTQPPGGD